jgi:inner membrane protein
MAVVLGLDVAHRALPAGALMTGILDEPAHLATAALALLACTTPMTRRRHRSLLLITLVSSMAIDVDHVPMYLGLAEAGGGRPPSHSLATVALLTAAAPALVEMRPLLLGAALGVALHLLRDLATGPGLHLWWPVSSTEVRAPYWSYAVVLAFLTCVATARAVRQRRTSPACAGV